MFDDAINWSRIQAWLAIVHVEMTGAFSGSSIGTPLVRLPDLSALKNLFRETNFSKVYPLGTVKQQGTEATIKGPQGKGFPKLPPPYRVITAHLSDYLGVFAEASRISPGLRVFSM